MGYKKNIASNFITQIIVTIIAFITSVIVARVLGPEDKGFAAYLLLIFTLVGQYGHFGITSASTYFQKKSDYKADEIFRTNVTYLLFVFLIIVISIITLRVNNLFMDDYNWLLILEGLFFVLFTLLNDCIVNFYIADERIPEVNKYNLIMNIFKSITIFILAILNRLNVPTFILFQFVPIILAVLLLYKNLGIKFKFNVNMILLKKEFLFGILIYLSTLFIYLNYRVDQIFIKNMLGQIQLGIYSIAVSLAELLFLIPGSVGTAILGRLYNIKNDNEEEKKHITILTVKYTFYVCLIIGIAGIFMTPLIPLVYGAKYMEASKPTAILFIGIIFASIGKVSSSYFQSIGKPQIHLLITGLTLIINIILNIILIPKMGINGAAVASSISYFFYGVIYLVVFDLKENYKFKEFFIIDKSEINNFILIPLKAKFFKNKR